MSSSSSVLLPALYSIQKSLEDMHRRYGKTCLDKDQSGGKTIPRSVINNFYTNLTQYLIRYNLLRISIQDTHAQKERLLKTFFALFVIIILAVFFVFMYFFVFKKSKLWLKVGNNHKLFELVYFGAVATLLFIYGIMMGEAVFTKKLDTYRKVYNIPNGDGSTGDEIFKERTIRDFSEMFVFNAYPKDKNEDFTPDKVTCPAISYLICKYKGWKACPSDDYEDDDSTTDKSKFVTDACAVCLKDCAPSGSAATGANEFQAQEACLFGKCALDYNVDPYVLFRKLQRYDIAYQVSRISDSMAYLKGLLLKERDVVAGQSQQKTDLIATQVSNILSINYQRLTDFVLWAPADAGTQIDVFTPDECHAVAISEDQYAMSVFDKSTSQSRLFTKSDMETIMLVYMPGSQNTHDILIKNNVNVNITGKKEINIDSTGDGQRDGTIKGVRNELCNILQSNKPKLDNTTVYYDCHQLPLNLTYKDVFGSVTDVEASKLLTENPSLTIFKTQFTNDTQTNMSSLMNSMIRILTKSVVQRIRTEDNTQTFVLEDKILTKIKGKLTQFYGVNYPSVSVAITKIMDDAKMELDRLRFQSIDPKDPKSKFIDYSRFAAKVQDMGQDVFINDLLYHIDEVRHTSEGLKYMYEVYDYSRLVHEQNTYMLMVTFIILCIIGGSEMIRFCIDEYFGARKTILDINLADLETQGYNFDKFAQISCKMGISSDMANDVLTCPPHLVHKTEEEKKEQKTLEGEGIGKVKDKGKTKGAKDKKDKEESIEEMLEEQFKDQYKFDNKMLQIKKYFVKRLSYKLTKECKMKTANVVYDAVLKVVFVFMIYIVLISMVYSWMEKSKSIYQFNKMTLETNGDMIVRNSTTTFDILVDDFILRGKLVSVNTSKVNDSTMDALDSDVKLRQIQQNAMLNGEKVILNDNDDMFTIYDNLTSMVDAFDKCNTLLLNTDSTLPFPMLEISIYLIMIVILLIISAVVVIKLKPHSRIFQLRVWTKLREKLRLNMDIAEEDQDFCTEDDVIDKLDTDSVVKLVAIVLLPVFTILFASTLMNNSMAFTSSLYASDLFRNMDCYKI